MTDKLTGMWNRVKLDKLLVSQLKAYQRHAETYSLVLLDVDHFKQVNDTYGHNAGDAVLVDLANILKSNVRGNDVVGRWGGEEFMMLLSNSNAIKAQVVAEKMRVLVKQHQFPGVGNVTISLGICEVSRELSVLEMIDCADQALYKAKKKGRDQVCLAVLDRMEKIEPKKLATKKVLVSEAVC